MCDTNLQGEKNQTQYTPKQLQEDIEVENCRYDTLQYEPAEYLLDEGTKILIHSNLTAISRTKLFDRKGDRIYIISNAISATVTPLQ